MEIEIEPTINYVHTSSWHEAFALLSKLPDTIACDFEAASKYTNEEREAMKVELETETNPNKRIKLSAAINSNALSHPYYVAPTHLSIAWSETDAIVIVMPNDRIRRYIMRWLVHTSRKQLWHNFGYDGKLIYYWTRGKLPKDIEDTALLAKTLLNHVEVWKANVKLKHLMGYKYGSWAVSSDKFDLSHIHDESLIKYAAIDACAGMALWNSMQQHMGVKK